MRRKIVLLLAGLFLARLASAAPLESIDRLHRQGNTVADYKKIERLLRQSPEKKSDALLWRLARTYASLGNRAVTDREKKKYFTRCRDSAERALALNKRAAAGYYFKALCMGKLGRLQGVFGSLSLISTFRKNMEKAARLDPSVEQGGAHRALGKYYAALPALLGRSFKKSIRHLKQAVRYGPTFADNYFFLAESYDAAGNAKAARSTIRAYLRAVQKFPDTPKLREQRRRARQLLKKF
ncbi:MAG: TRAP transporter TatT component family protein [Nitrospinales bacterium]